MSWTRRHLLHVLLGITFWAAIVLGAPASLQAATPAPTPLPRPPAVQDKRAAAGREIYLKNYCGICHALATAGTRGTFGPPHDGLATTARERIADPAYTGEAVTAAQYLRESIVEPAIYASPGYIYTSHPMPTYSHLPRRDLDALIYFLMQQK